MVYIGTKKELYRLDINNIFKSDTNKHSIIIEYQAYNESFTKIERNIAAFVFCNKRSRDRGFLRLVSAIKKYEGVVLFRGVIEVQF